MKRRSKKVVESSGCSSRTVTMILGSVILVIACSCVDFETAFGFKSSERKSSGDWKHNKPHNKSKAKDLDDISRLALQKQPPQIFDNWVKVSTDSVPHVRWMNVSTLMKAVNSKKPTVFKHNNIMQWSLFDLNLLKLADGATGTLHLNGTRWQPEPVFVLGQEREKGGMIGSAQDHPLSYTNVTLAQFVASTFDDRNWLYWTGELSYWEESAMPNMQALNRPVNGSYNDWRDFRIKEKGLAWNGNHGNSSSVDSSLSEGEQIDEADDVWRPMIWLSHPGVVAQTHYDTQHNMFVQVLGSKRFFLFPPSTELYSYPNIHRSYRQSQAHLESSTADRFAMVNPRNTTAYEVVLHPGDVLYIPPYWHHRVESLTLAVSLSILSPSYAEASLAEVFWENVPFGAFQNKRGLRTRAVHTYLSLLLQEVRDFTSNATLQEFAQRIYQTRFATLNIKHKVFPTCFEQRQKVDNAGAGGSPTDSISSTAAEVGELEGLMATHMPKFQSAAKNVAQMLLQIDADDAIKVTFMRDYIEQLTRWAVGPDYTASFIEKCLTLI